MVNTKELVDEIKNYNYSPIEQIMHVYDLVRGNTAINDNSTFSVVFNNILKELGIDSRVVSFIETSNKKEYFRNEIYINDSKYGIDGVYYFDITADSHLKDNYLSTYQHFAMTKEEMTFYDGDAYTQEAFSYLSISDLNKYKEYILKGDYSGVPYRIYKSINYMANRLYGNQLYIKNRKNVIIDKEEINNKADDLYTRFNRPLYSKDLLRILYRVRRNEYYKEPDKYSLSPKSFVSIIINSHWSFEDDLMMIAINKYRKSEVLIKHQIIVFKKFMEYHELEDKIIKIIESRKAGILLDSTTDINDKGETI